MSVYRWYQGGTMYPRMSILYDNGWALTCLSSDGQPLYSRRFDTGADLLYFLKVSSIIAK
jgi:hypothetical protein